MPLTIRTVLPLLKWSESGQLHGELAVFVITLQEVWETNPMLLVLTGVMNTSVKLGPLFTIRVELKLTTPQRASVEPAVIIPVLSMTTLVLALPLSPTQMLPIPLAGKR